MAYCISFLKKKWSALTLYLFLTAILLLGTSHASSLENEVKKVEGQPSEIQKVEKKAKKSPTIGENIAYVVSHVLIWLSLKTGGYQQLKWILIFLTLLSTILPVLVIEWYRKSTNHLVRILIQLLGISITLFLTNLIKPNTIITKKESIWTAILFIDVISLIVYMLYFLIYKATTSIFGLFQGKPDTNNKQNGALLDKQSVLV